MFKEKHVAIVTGGANGIGFGIVSRLLKDGYNVVIADINEELLKKSSKKLETQGYSNQFTIIQGDVVKKEDHELFVNEAVDKFGRLDTYINNAGIVQIKLLEDETSDDIEKIFKTNVFSVLYGIQAATKQFRKQADKNKIRKIINASSIAGHVAFDMLGAYSSTKFAIRGITQAAAKELGRDNITVNAYCPGIVGTSMWDYIDEEMVKAWGGKKGDYLKKYSESITLGRVETPEDVANYVSYLASSNSDYMTGQAVQIDGGIQFI